MLEGGCQCGLVRYQVDDEISDLCHCHCSICRRLHGAGFASFARAGLASFQWLTGENRLGRFASSAGTNRVFCRECGSQLLMLVSAKPDDVFLTMGTLDGEPAFPEPYHEFAQDAADWCRISDDLPQYPTTRDAG